MVMEVIVPYTEMIVDHLEPEELRYELEIRGVKYPQNLTDKRKALKQFLNQTADPNESVSTLSIDMDRGRKELLNCKRKLVELESEIIENQNDRYVLRLFYSRLAHIEARLRRISQLMPCLSDKCKRAVEDLRVLVGEYYEMSGQISNNEQIPLIDEASRRRQMEQVPFSKTTLSAMLTTTTTTTTASIGLRRATDSSTDREVLAGCQDKSIPWFKSSKSPYSESRTKGSEYDSPFACQYGISRFMQGDENFNLGLEGIGTFSTLHGGPKVSFNKFQSYSQDPTSLSDTRKWNEYRLSLGDFSPGSTNSKEIKSSCKSDFFPISTELNTTVQTGYPQPPPNNSTQDRDGSRNSSKTGTSPDHGLSDFELEVQPTRQPMRTKSEHSRAKKTKRPSLWSKDTNHNAIGHTMRADESSFRENMTEWIDRVTRQVLSETLSQLSIDPMNTVNLSLSGYDGSYNAEPVENWQARH